MDGLIIYRITFGILDFYTYICNKINTCMTRKLTLTIEENIIDVAKEYAHKNGISLSGLIEGYLKLITHQTELKDSDLSPKVKKLLGSVKMTKGLDYKAQLSDALIQKYK